MWKSTGKVPLPSLLAWVCGLVGATHTLQVKVFSHLQGGKPEVQRCLEAVLVIWQFAPCCTEPNPNSLFWLSKSPPIRSFSEGQARSIHFLFFFAKLLPLPETLPPSTSLVKFNRPFKAQLRCHFPPLDGIHFSPLRISCSGPFSHYFSLGNWTSVPFPATAQQ